jgi:hypothetical protein
MTKHQYSLNQSLFHGRDPQVLCLSFTITVHFVCDRIGNKNLVGQECSRVLTDKEMTTYRTQLFQKASRIR